MATAPAQTQIKWDKWSELSKILERNPNKALALRENTLSGPPQTLTIHPPGSPEFWQEYVVQPGGILSAFLHCRDPFFADATPRLRQQMLIDASIDINQELDEKIRATPFARYRKKALEWLGTAAGRLSREDSLTLWEILMAVFGYQCLVIDTHEAATVHFAPADVRTWTRDKPLLIVNETFTHVWVSIKWNTADLLTWLDTRTTVHWPVAQGTKLELLQRWELSPSYKETDRKKLKDELAALVGKSEAIRSLLESA